MGSAGSAIDAASIGFSTIGRYFKVPNFSPSPTKTVSLNGYGYSFDALIPMIPATDAMHPDNALTFTGSFVYGQAIADLYTGLSGGASFAALPPNAIGAPQNYPQDVDNGLVGFTADGVLHAIRWESYILGLQYYLPTPNRMFVSANYSHMHSSDIKRPRRDVGQAVRQVGLGRRQPVRRRQRRRSLRPRVRLLPPELPRRLGRQGQPHPALGALHLLARPTAHAARQETGGRACAYTRSTTFSQSSHWQCGPPDICAALGWVLP